MQSPPSSRADKLAWAIAFPDSGLTARQYADLAGCSVAKLYYWRAQFKNANADPSFTSIIVHDDAPLTVLRLRLPDGVEVHGTPAALADFVHQLRARA